MIAYTGEMQSLHIVERAAVFHLVFETIHPFIDGNGRTGRLLMNLELMREGYPPVNVKFTDREKYYNCFDHYRGNNGDASKMIELVGEYSIGELKRYIEISEQAEMLTDELRKAQGAALKK